MASALELLNSLDTSGVELFDPSKAFEFYHRLSHSNITDFKSCPRRWQLTRFRKDRESTVHTAFGHAVGEAVAKKAIAKGIDTVVFDRGGYIYHGRVAALAEGAREAGLKF